MDRREAAGKILDEVLHLAITASAIGSAFVLPNILVALDKPLAKYYKSYDKRQREREAKRIIYYMKSHGYIKGEYEHGLTITSKGMKRLENVDFENLQIANQEKWDGLWRLVIYDIPEKHKHGRDMLTSKLRQLGFFQLQRSAWIHPLPCREVVERVCSEYGIAKYVSYVEALRFDNQKALIRRFQKRLPRIKF